MEPLINRPNTLISLCSWASCLCWTYCTIRHRFSTKRFQLWSLHDHWSVTVGYSVPKGCIHLPNTVSCQNRTYRTGWGPLLSNIWTAVLYRLTWQFPTKKQHCLQDICSRCIAQVSVSVHLYLKSLYSLCTRWYYPVLYSTRGHGQDVMAVIEQAHDTFTVYT